MKFDKLIANPPYNAGKLKIYHKCVDAIMRLTDRATVICPDRFKNCKEGHNKIVTYDHKGEIWQGVGVDVAIFELNNNHNSHVCRTPDGTIYQLREEICEQLRQQIGDKCLRDLYIKANDIKGEWFNKVTFMKRGVVNCIKDFSLKDDNDYYGIEYHVVPGRTFKVVKQSKKQTGIIKLTDAEYTGFINVISNSQFKLMFTELNTQIEWTMSYGAHIPIPSDLTDKRLLNDEYVTELNFTRFKIKK